jgi:NAD(P)-dependent dehydrogenase (short-subunit alcohol dehydrogenase family)
MQHGPAVRHCGGLHILHANAGGSTAVDRTVVDMPPEEFWLVIRLDLFGTWWRPSADRRPSFVGQNRSSAPSDTLPGSFRFRLT